MRKAEVLAHFGNRAIDVAAALGITHSAVSQWSDPIPELRARQLHELTHGSLKYNPNDYKKPDHQ